MMSTKLLKEDMNIPQCKYFVKRKKRFCRMTVRPGRFYCGEHEPEPMLDSGEPDKRIPCPLDPKHTCYESKLEKHLEICNARQTDSPAYILNNINIPNKVTEAVPRKPLSEMCKADIYLVIDKVNKVYDEIIANSIDTLPQSDIHHVITEEYNDPDRGDSTRRHLRQASALMHLMQDEKLVDDKYCYVELGAGKGHLSYYTCMAWCQQNSSRSVLIDRAALRHKRDNKLREPKEEGRVTRIRADLAHLSLGDVDAVTDCKGVVGFAKHLCGVATDLALRCITEPRVLSRTRGIVLATCCHHRCEYTTYVGRPYLEKIGITPEEYNIMLGIVSWYTCGDGLSRDKRTSQENTLTNKQTQTVPDIQNTEANKETKSDRIPTNNNSGNEIGSQLNNTNKSNESKIFTETEFVENGLSISEYTSNNSNSNVNTSKGDGNSVNDKETTTKSYYNLTREEKEEIGRRAKVIIDWGRVQYLKSLGFEARLCHFVPTSVSLENVCIVAKKDVS